MTIHTLRLARIFVNDCLDCECDVGEPEAWFAHTVRLAMTEPQLRELHSRAAYYCHPYGAPDADGLEHIKASAARVKARLETYAAENGITLRSY